MNHNKIKRSKENLVEGEETGGARAEGCAGQKACYLETGMYSSHTASGELIKSQVSLLVRH